MTWAFGGIVDNTTALYESILGSIPNAGNTSKSHWTRLSTFAYICFHIGLYCKSLWITATFGNVIIVHKIAKMIKTKSDSNH